MKTLNKSGGSGTKKTHMSSDCLKSLLSEQSTKDTSASVLGLLSTEYAGKQALKQQATTSR